MQAPWGVRFHNKPYVNLLLSILTEHCRPRKSAFTALVADPMLSPGLMGSADQPRPTQVRPVPFPTGPKWAGGRVRDRAR